MERAARPVGGAHDAAHQARNGSEAQRQQEGGSNPGRVETTKVGNVLLRGQQGDAGDAEPTPRGVHHPRTSARNELCDEPFGG